ncbi:MAG TPA: adenylate/guanylate cyclase domain-containing protein [Chloroflexia bacterium]|nr:adenylate/guanylate cyclase domain-containing protein [Chloroflexia bacterium]
MTHYRRLRHVGSLPLWLQLLIPLAGLIVLALGADAWLFLTTTSATRLGILDQTLRDRPSRLRTLLADEATAVQEGARYLARAGSSPLAATPPDLVTLQQSVDDLYYRFNLDRYGFDLVQIYTPAGHILLSLATDPALDAGPPAPPGAAERPSTLYLLPQQSGVLLVGTAPILRGGRLLGTTVVGRVVDNAYLARLQQAMNGPVVLSLAGQLYSSFPRSPTGSPWLPAMRQTLDGAAAGQTGTTLFSIGGRTYAATYGPLDLAGARGGFAILTPTDSADQLVQTGLQASLSLLGLTLLLVLAGALHFAATVTRPVTELARAAAAIRAGDLSRRARVARLGEIGRLGRTFNAMAAELQRVLRELGDERDRADQLLRNILPDRIAVRLKHEPRATAESFADVTVLFADIVDFTRLAGQLTPEALVVWLNTVFSAFDGLTEQHGLEKIKTIGDAYMVVGGLTTPRPDHPAAVADFALALQAVMARHPAPDGSPMRLRIGIATGPVVAGVIGSRKFSYDLWGDTVNSASRMESHGVAGNIQVTAPTYERLCDRYRFEPRGLVEVKGKGAVPAYWLRDPLDTAP